MSDYYDEDDFDPIEGYCMSCRESVEIENPQPVWTRRGMPATRGVCPMCAGTVFRMGATHQHDEGNRPAPIQISETDGKRNLPRLQQDSAYVAYAEPDEEFAQRVADDLSNSGIAAWLHEHGHDDVAWAGGVHPALAECTRLVFVLSTQGLQDASVTEAWQFFKQQRKPIVIAQVERADPPDAIRRSPRFDFEHEYKKAFRQMIQALSS